MSSALTDALPPWGDRFISRLGERALPFFKLLKKSVPIDWTPEVDAALQDLKMYLSSPPILVTPRIKEPLLLYLSETTQEVSVVLVAEREEDSPTKPMTQNPGRIPEKGHRWKSSRKAHP